MNKRILSIGFGATILPVFLCLAALAEIPDVDITPATNSCGGIRFDVRMLKQGVHYEPDPGIMAVVVVVTPGTNTLYAKHMALSMWTGHQFQAAVELKPAEEPEIPYSIRTNLPPESTCFRFNVRSSLLQESTVSIRATEWGLCVLRLKDWVKPQARSEKPQPVSQKGPDFDEEDIRWAVAHSETVGKMCNLQIEFGAWNYWGVYPQHYQVSNAPQSKAKLQETIKSAPLGNGVALIAWIKGGPRDLEATKRALVEMLQKRGYKLVLDKQDRNDFDDETTRIADEKRADQILKSVFESRLK